MQKITWWCDHNAHSKEELERHIEIFHHYGTYRSGEDEKGKELHTGLETCFESRKVQRFPLEKVKA